jgi:hypothetical protein
MARPSASSSASCALARRVAHPFFWIAARSAAGLARSTACTALPFPVPARTGPGSDARLRP